MKLFLTAIGIYALVVAGMYLGQRRLQYFPDSRPIAPADAGLTAFSLEQIATPDGETLMSWFAPASDGKATIIYFQGNAAGLADRAGSFADMHAAGYGVFALGYRGYSGSTGSPSEAGLLIDAKAAVAHLGEKGIGLKQLVFFGESLGTGLAVQLAANEATAPAAVILEAPYTAIVEIAAKRYWFLPVGLLMKDQYRSIDFAPQLKSPAFIFHGEDDTLIPPQHARDLHAVIPTDKELHIIPNRGHIEEVSPELFAKIAVFLEKHTRP